jgi:hypothetical protein
VRCWSDFYDLTLESTLKQMADSFVCAIEALSVHPVELAHADGEIGLGRFHQQMIMGLAIKQ